MINVYKEAGYTSFDVVAKLRGILHQKKIGHTGTLDPAATGVLPVCLGSATKLVEELTDKIKEYEAVLLLGTVTDSYDTTGTVLKTEEVAVKEEEVKNVIQSFLGEIWQVPPMYSAIKIDGKRLYELAREGKEIERPARKVTIHEIEILETDLPRIRMRIRCGKGTYIRSLCYDIGEKLGCGGCMESLVRTASGPFLIGDALTLDEIKALKDSGHLTEKILPVEWFYRDLPSVKIAEEYGKLLDNGNPLPLSDDLRKVCDGTKVRICRPDGSFKGIYRYESQKNLYVVDKLFS